MTDIFLSYASEDRERVRPLVDHLQSLGWSVWWDRELVAGPSFDEKIDAAISDASCVVVAWSRASIASKWVRAEAHEGLERGILVPMLLEDVRPPLVFRASHAANLIGWPGRRPETELNALITGIREIVGTTPQQNAVIDAEISSRSIAVLRFADMSPEHDQTPLCEGIADEILNRLAQIRDLKVIARTSSFQFDPSNTNVREINQRLGVRHVLEGSVRTAGSQVRISARLVECEGQSHLWSESYTRELVDLFMLYDEVAAAIARALALVISDDRPKSITPPTRSEEALKSVALVRFRLEETGDPRSLFALVERAIALDPDYADAHCARGQLYFALADSLFELPEAPFLAAQESLETALLLHPELRLAHGLLGWIRAQVDLDWGLAVESWRRADHLRGYPVKYAQLCFAGYYEQAEQDCLRYIERDPLSAHPQLWLGRILDRLGRIEEATQQYEKTLALAPHHPVVWGDFFDHLVRYAGDLDRAERIIDVAELPEGWLRFVRALVAQKRGDDRPLRSWVETAIAHRATRYVPARSIDVAFLDLGDYAEHIHWLAVREHEKDGLFNVPLELRDRPDYWARLGDWILDNSTEARARMALVNEHHARIDRITERMVLPRDYVESSQI